VEKSEWAALMHSKSKESICLIAALLTLFAYVKYQQQFATILTLHMCEQKMEIKNSTLKKEQKIAGLFMICAVY